MVKINKENKKNIRRKIKEEIANLDHSYINFTNEAIYKNIISMNEYKNARTVFCFVSTKDEIDTTKFIETALKDGKIICVPKCIGLGIMKAYVISCFDDLKDGKYNIKEPKDYCKLLEPDQIDLGIIPCLSCNENGERLGYGAGFYDRYLSDTSFFKTVLCREKIMYNDIPIDKYDVLMDAVINEYNVVRLPNK